MSYTQRTPSRTDRPEIVYFGQVRYSAQATTWTLNLAMEYVDPDSGKRQRYRASEYMDHEVDSETAIHKMVKEHIEIMHPDQEWSLLIAPNGLTGSDSFDTDDFRIYIFKGKAPRR